MGVTGVLISSSVGGLGIVLSIIAIRRKLRGRKAEHREVSTEIFCGSAVECSDAVGGRDIAFIKTCTADLLSKRSAAVVQSHHDSSGVDSLSHEHTIQASHALHKRETREDHPATKTIAADGVSKLHQDERVTGTRNGIQGGSEPLKEFITQAPIAASTTEAWEHSFEAFELRENTAVEYDRASNDLGSETDSCSFSECGYLSAEEKVEGAEDGGVIETRFEMPTTTDRNGKQGKTISSQLDCASQHEGYSHSELDSENPTAADMNEKNAIAEIEDMVSVVMNDDKAIDISADARAPSPAIDDSDSQKEGGIPKFHDAMMETEGVSDFVTSGEVSQPCVHSEDQNLRKEKEPSFVSVEPLAHMPALDDVMTASPMSMTPIIVRNRNYTHMYSPSVESDVISPTEKHASEIW